jgi:hypothetical protein
LHGPHKENKDEVDCECYRRDKKTGVKKCRFNYPTYFNEETNLEVELRRKCVRGIKEEMFPWN